MAVERQMKGVEVLNGRDRPCGAQLDLRTLARQYIAKGVMCSDAKL